MILVYGQLSNTEIADQKKIQILTNVYIGKTGEPFMYRYVHPSDANWRISGILKCCVL